MRTILHTHWESDKDAVPSIKDCFDRAEKLGIEAVAVTDHGSLNAITDIWDENARRGNPLNIIYGIEAYVKSPLYEQDDKTAHMIIMAKNQTGKKAIDKVHYLANGNLNSKGFPVISYEMLEEIFGKDSPYRDSCFFTTACIAGIPSLELLANDTAKSRIAKLEEKLARAVSEGKAVAGSELNADTLRNAEKAFSEISEKVKTLKSTVSKKYDGIRKRAAAARDKGFPEKAEELEKQASELERAVLLAKNELKSALEEQKNLKEKVSALKKEQKENTSKVERYEKFVSEIKREKSLLVADDRLYINAKESVRSLAEIVGRKNLFVEIQYHGLSDEEYCYSSLIRIARELKLKLVAANDSHMVDNSWKEMTRRSVAKFLRYGTIFDDSEEYVESEKEMYLKTPEELREWLLKVYPEDAVDEALGNADVIGDICHVEPIKESHYPVFDKSQDAGSLLRAKTEAGIETRFPGREGWTDEYQARMERELEVICSMGYADYHLIVADFIEYGQILGRVPEWDVPNAPLNVTDLKKWCAEKGYDTGIGIGPGRGSAAGSLVCYLIGITNIDPIKYGLLFERFLNPERYSMPDIDVDFSLTVREKVVEYVTAIHGEKAVCHILTKSYQQTKGAVRDAARYYGAKETGNDKAFLGLGNAIRKKVPEVLGISFDSEMPRSTGTVYEYLCNTYKDSPDALEILKIAKAIEGSFFGYGVHAAGVVISDNDDLTEYMPLRFNNKLGCYTTCCTKEQVEDFGFLKMDFLNLRNLNIITDALNLIKKHHGVSYDAMNLPVEDEVIREVFARGRTIGIFQFESAGMRKYLKQMHPERIEDLFIMNAMYRPGPLQFIDMVCEIKNGRRQEEYLCEELKPILSPTYSAIVYQEEVMQICMSLAGYSMGKADMVRKYMSKKKADKLAEERQSFVYGDPARDIKGCVPNGISEEAANKIFDQMMDFASYAFNKSHAAAYSMVAYATGWLKYHYSAEYFCALLNWTSKTEDYFAIIKDAREFGVEVLPPDINRSGMNFSVSNGKILFGLGSVKGVKSGAEAVIKGRDIPYADFKDFALRSEAGEAVTLSLIRCGAFDFMGYSRVSLEADCYADIKDCVKKLRAAKTDITELDAVIQFANANPDIADRDVFETELRKTGSAYKVPKKCPTADSLREKRNTLNEKISSLERELKDIKIRHINSDRAADLKYEKELLGTYVTGHPMSDYAEKCQISEVDESVTEITGVITSVEVKVNSSKKEWALLTVEDTSGEIKCSVFSNRYAALSDRLTPGSILKFTGKISVDDFNSAEETVYSMNVSSVDEPDRKSRESYVIDFEDYDGFRQMREKIGTCADSNGVEVYAYFIREARFFKLRYLCSPEKITLLGAKVI